MSAESVVQLVVWSFPVNDRECRLILGHGLLLHLVVFRVSIESCLRRLRAVHKADFIRFVLKFETEPAASRRSSLSSNTVTNKFKKVPPDLHSHHTMSGNTTAEWVTPSTRPELIENLVSGVDRYNPSNVSILEDYLYHQIRTNEYDCLANLAILKLYAHPFLLIFCLSPERAC